MKLSKLYSNNENFKTIVFEKGINFILSSENNVGKSSLFKLIDFCLLGDKSFLSQEEFKNDIFYIEVQIDAKRYITIKRPTVGGKNIELKITKQKSMLLDETDFNKKGSLGVAKSFLENKLNYSINKFRTYIAYFLRDTNNQNDIFRLQKDMYSHEIEYKTIVSNLLGIDGRKIRKKYELEKEIEKSDDQSKEQKTEELLKIIEDNKTLISSYFIENIQTNISKYGRIVLNKEVSFVVEFNIENDIEFTIVVENENDDVSLADKNTIEKLLCFIFEAALAETFVRKRLIKFVAFDSPFDGDKNHYEDGILNALNELHRKGIQSIITSNEDALDDPENLLEIKEDYMIKYLESEDKLLGNF